MGLLNGICITCIYGDGKPVTCSVCEGMLRGGSCLPCDLKVKKLFIRDPNAYSFNNFNYLPQAQFENYLCNLCGNNSHDGYDCQQQFPLVYEQELSYNQNYNDSYYPHDSPSFPCCDNCEGSHETFQCQPMDQNIDFSGSEQIQTPQYPEIHPPSQEISDEVFQAKGDLMKYIQIFLEEFNYIPFGEKPKILLQAWYKFFAIQHAQPEDSFQKLLEDLQIIKKEMTECNRLNFFNDNEDHSVKNKEYLENSSKEIFASNSNQEKEGPPQDFDIRQLIREECCIEVCEEQKQNMKDTILELDIEYVETSLPDPEIVSVEEENIVHHEEEEFDLEDILQIQDIVLREKLLSINHLITNIESLNDNPTPDRVLNSPVLFPISEESDNSLSDNSSPEFKTFCDHTEETRSGNTTTHADDSLPEYDSFCFEIEPDNSIPPGIENFADDSEGDIHFLEELLIDDFIHFPNNKSSESDFDNPSFPRPPSKPPDAEFETDPGEEISVVMNDELECLDPRDENDKDDDYFLFMLFIQIFLPYLICSKMFIYFLSVESEDTIFDPCISV
nr:hypothetical protein [Tanacetum cinerariifolium]